MLKTEISVTRPQWVKLTTNSLNFSINSNNILVNSSVFTWYILWARHEESSMSGGRRGRNFAISVYQKGQPTYLKNSGTKLDPNNIRETGIVFNNSIGLLQMRKLIVRSHLSYPRAFLWRVHDVSLFLALLYII